MMRRELKHVEVVIFFNCKFYIMILCILLVFVVLYNYELMHMRCISDIICLVHYLRPSNRKAQEEARMVAIPCYFTFHKRLP